MLRFLFSLSVLLSLAACAGGNRFVLLAEEDGSVGEIVIANEAGSQRVDTAKTATQVGSARSAPSAPKAISDAEIEKTWGETIQSSPLKPKTFILYFIVGSNRLTDESQAQLPAILDVFREYPAAEVAVVGHTDRVGSERRNAQLALDRAQTIRDLLIAEGLDGGLIEVDSHGESNTLIETADEVPEPRNRRVEVTVR